jgi:hypothetical protein
LDDPDAVLLCHAAILLVPLAVFLWGVGGFLLGYYRLGNQILRGDEARKQSLKVILLGWLLLILGALIGWWMLRSW